MFFLYSASRPRGFYPKPMVTPVRRFQSLESVSNNGLRYCRNSPGPRPNRPPVHNNAHIYYNNKYSCPNRIKTSKILENCLLFTVLEMSERRERSEKDRATPPSTIQRRPKPWRITSWTRTYGNSNLPC